MAKTLLNTINKQLSTPDSSFSPGAVSGGQTETVRGLLRAKTGRATTPGTAPRQSSIQERVAEQQTGAARQALAQQGRLLGTQLEQRGLDIAQREEQQEREFQEQSQDIKENLQRQTTRLLNDLERGKEQISSSRYISDLEQLGFNIRLQNKQYLNQLQTIGKKKRLDNELNFKTELAKQVFADQEELLKNDLAFSTVIDAEDREFNRELAQMDIDSALVVANRAIEAANQRARYQAAADTVTGTVEALSDAGKKGAFLGLTGSPNVSGAPNPSIQSTPTGEPSRITEIRR